MRVRLVVVGSVVDRESAEGVDGAGALGEGYEGQEEGAAEGASLGKSGGGRSGGQQLLHYQTLSLTTNFSPRR